MSMSNNQVLIDEINKSVTEKNQKSFVFIVFCLFRIKQEFVWPRWPYDMRPSARAEKYMCVIVIR